MALLAAVAAQAATALENGRLYRQLRIKADELDRMREFSENILESLNDGLAVVNRDDRVVRWNRRLEELYGLRHEDAVGRPPRRDPGRRRSSRCCAARGASRPTARRSTACRSRRGTQPPRQRARQRGDDAAARRGRRDRRDDPDHRRHLGARAARGAAADLREDGVDRPARGRRRARGQHAADRHLELHADAHGGRRAGRSRRRRCSRRSSGRRSAPRKIVNGLLNLARPAQVDSGPVDINAVINDVLSLLEHQMRTGRIQVRKELRRDRADRAGHRIQAAAGVPQPVPQRARRDAEGRLADDRHARPTAPTRRSRSRTPARAFRPISSRASTIRSSRRRRSARAPASGCRSPTASCRSTAARSPATARSGRARGSRLSLPLAATARRSAHALNHRR